jgi:hypothetical protein
MTNGWEGSAIRAKMVADLGLDASADDDAIVDAVKALKIRSMIAAAVGMSPAVDDETLAGAIRKRRNLIEAAKQSVQEVRLQKADRRAIDATVAASSDPFADARERQVLDQLGLPVAQVPPPVLLQKGIDPADYNREDQYRDFMHKIGLGRQLGVPRPPAGDSWYQPSPNDPYRWDASAGRFVEKQPFHEAP